MKNIFSITKVFAQDNFNDVVGKIEVPAGVKQIQTEAGEGNIGLLIFISKMLKVVALVGSVWVVINLVIAAYIYLTSGGKAESHAKVSNILIMSVIGLLIIVVSYTFAGLIGVIFFGDVNYIINPTIEPMTSVNMTIE